MLTKMYRASTGELAMMPFCCCSFRIWCIGASVLTCTAYDICALSTVERPCRYHGFRYQEVDVPWQLAVTPRKFCRWCRVQFARVWPSFCRWCVVQFARVWPRACISDDFCRRPPYLSMPRSGPSCYKLPVRCGERTFRIPDPQKSDVSA